MSTLDFFRARLADMIDLRHPLAALVTRMPWRTLETTHAPMIARKARPGVGIEVADLFGPSLQAASSRCFAPVGVVLARAGYLDCMATVPTSSVRAGGRLCVADGCSASGRRVNFAGPTG